MMRLVAAVCVLGILLTLTGCSSNLKGDQETKDLIAALREASAAKEPRQAAEAAEKVMAARSRVEALKLTAEEKKQLSEKYASELAKYK